MLMGAHAMRASNILLALLSFSRGFLANTRGSSNPKAVVFLTRRSCHNIQMWCLLLTMAFHDPRVLQCSTATPLLRMKLHSDDDISSRDSRSIHAAALLTYSDACTGDDSTSPGIGGYRPGHGWFGHRYKSLRFMLVQGKIVETPINVLELMALIVTASLTIQTYITQYGSARGRHFHIFCDNVASVAKARTHRSDYPIYSYLLYILSYIKSRLHGGVQLLRRGPQHSSRRCKPLLFGPARPINIPPVPPVSTSVSAIEAMYQRYEPDIVEL